MSKIRIGKDITIQWLNIKTNGQALALEGRDLSLSLKMPNGSKINLPFEVIGTNGIQATYRGIDHRCIGKHSLTLWENLGKVGENAIDKMRCFELVSTTEEEVYNGATEGFNTTTIALEGGVFVVGIKGDSGDAPTITSTKVGKVTKIYSNGVEVASINDGADGSISEADKAEIAGMVDLSGKQDKLSAQQLANINADHSQYLKSSDIANKVDKVDGMGLSSNDYTTAEKNKVAEIDSLYRKPNGGIPLTDLAQSVQSSLGKADSALQSSAIADMETKTHASQTYQAKGSYMADTPSGDPLHYAYVNAGAIWNNSIKLWSLNGIHDLTNSDMQTIYYSTFNHLLFLNNYSQAFANNNNLRTNLINGITSSKLYIKGAISYAQMFQSDSNIEVVNLESSESYPARINNFGAIFRSCKKLKKVLGYLDLSANTNIGGSFESCYLLEYIRIKGLKTNMSFSDSPNLSKSSILYIIQKASNGTTNITITLHPTAYAMADADSDIQDALTTNGHISLVSA